MKIIAKILDFLFGKDPQIFAKDGSVEHQLDQKKWEDWDRRYQEGSEYNWRTHRGTQ